MLELSAKTNLLEENDYRYSLQDVKDPVLYRDVYNYDEVPKVAFNHRRGATIMPAAILITGASIHACRYLDHGHLLPGWSAVHEPLHAGAD